MKKPVMTKLGLVLEDVHLDILDQAVLKVNIVVYLKHY
jgi:hypothetical protein